MKVIEENPLGGGGGGLNSPLRWKGLSWFFILF